MGRLINADKLNFSEQHYNKSQTKAILDFVDAQPTAYDPDKVVEQLKSVSYERYGNDGMGGERVINMDDAIEIVKGGGVDG
ncbi:hypothetical protein ACQRCQ_03250 [Lachnospiraceae bacterium SGI.085]